MAKIRIIFSVLLLISVFAFGRGWAVEVYEEATDETGDFEDKYEVAIALLDAAQEIAEERNSGEALSYMKMAYSIAEEARIHWDAGDYVFALEDLAESNRFATYAIIFSKGGGGSLRETVLKLDMRLRSEEEYRRMEERVKRGILEAEVFIKTGERLLSEGQEHPGAREKLENSRKILAASKKEFISGDYQKALSGIKEAYTLATESIKDIKHSSSEIITFPKPYIGDEKEQFAHELRKNDTYFVFLRGVSGDRALVRQAKKLREEAVAASQAGNYQEAIDKLTASTGMLIDAIKGETLE